MVLRVRRHQTGWAVFDDDAPVSGIYASQTSCCKARDQMVVRAGRPAAQDRKCMTCADTFKSEGPWHRMCARCRAGAGRLGKEFL